MEKSFVVKDVLIIVKGLQGIGEEEVDETEFITVGKLVYEADRALVTYEESEIIGMKGTTTNVLIKGPSVQVSRSGTNNHLMFYEVGKRHIGNYSTPHGDFNIAVTALKVETDIDQNGGDIYIEYITEFNDIAHSKNSLYMHVKERTSNS